MWFKIIFLSILCQFCVFNCAEDSVKYFRKDYIFFESIQSFYKINTLHLTWQNAKKTCAMEGASMFYPQDVNEAELVTEFLTKTQPFQFLYVGASDVLAHGVYETINGVPMIDAYRKWAPGEPNAGHPQNCVVLNRDGTLQDEDCAKGYPFVCKKSLSTLKWDNRCNMPYEDYKFNEATGHCYKFHLNPLNWSDAYATCSGELSYLAVINSHGEADFLVDLTAKAPKDNVHGDYERQTVYLGFHNFAPAEGWMTIKGVPMQDSGYTRWARGEPNNAGGNEKCGVMLYNGNLNDCECHQRRFFICEHDVRPLTTQEAATTWNNENVFEKKLNGL